MNSTLSKRLLKAASTAVIAFVHHFTILAEVDPKVLLAGVKSVREQTPASEVSIRMTFRTPTGENQGEYKVIFDGSRRMFLSQNGNQPSRILFDGEQVYRFDGETPGAVTIRNPDTQLADPLFDPRLLGITTSYSWASTPEQALGFPTSALSIVGREVLSGKSVWHIRANRRENNHIDFWIVPDKAFAVLKVEEVAGGIGSRTSVSSYTEQSGQGLPNKVQTTSYDASGALRYTHTIEILTNSTHLVTSNSSWTLSALLGGIKTPTWIPVTDVRSSKVVGYWRDGELGPPYPWEPAPKRPGISGKRIASIVAIVVIATALFVYGQSLKRSLQSTQNAK